MNRKFIGIVLAFALGAVAAVLWFRPKSDWKFVRRTTGFDFPRGTDYLAQHDNAEWFIVSVVRLPQYSIQAFAAEHHFSPGKRHELRTALFLPEKYRDIPDRPDVLCAAGQKEYQAWEAVLDPATRLLWIHVAYPDRGGTHPGTAPQPPNQ